MVSGTIEARRPKVVPYVEWRTVRNERPTKEKDSLPVR
jgi:hypothetical protein